MAGKKEVIRNIYEVLPKLNCGFCGYGNCGQFARAVAEGKASPFGCRQNPWVGYKISETTGVKAPAFGYRYAFYQPIFAQRTESLPPPTSLGEEIGALSQRVDDVLARIEKLGKKQINLRQNMCIATTYFDDGEHREEVMRDVVQIEVERDGFLCFSLLGERKFLKGKSKTSTSPKSTQWCLKKRRKVIVNSYKVTFLPDRKEIEVHKGVTLFEAAEKAGIQLNSLCGGEGVCGKCRVQATKGNVKADKNSIVFCPETRYKKVRFLLARLE